LRLRKAGPASKETLDYAEILRGDPCSYCGAPVQHIDHIVPVVAGGRSEWQNLAASCQACNQAKHASSLLAFLAAR
jgi:5-methylcytosine-specific restriction endonuclease McrA